MLSGMRRNLWLSLIAFLAIGVSLYMVIQYAVIGADGSSFVQDKRNHMELGEIWYVMLYIHIASSITAICTGWLQFIGKLRTRKYRLHKAFGRIYSVGVLIGGISGLYLSLYATGGWISSLGFSALSLLWLFTLGRSLHAIIVKKDRLTHEKWMTRNYALTLAAVTLRIYLPLSMLLFGFEHFNDYYSAIAWLCWMTNLLVAEWLNRPQRRTTE